MKIPLSIFDYKLIFPQSPSPPTQFQGNFNLRAFDFLRFERAKINL